MQARIKAFTSDRRKIKIDYFSESYPDVRPMKPARKDRGKRKQINNIASKL